MPFIGSLKVLVVDDHLGIRIGIASLIDAERPRMCIVGSAANAFEAVERVHSLQPDVVVLDVNLGGEDGLALIPVLHRAAPCAVVVLTSLSDPNVAACAQRLGALGCVHKSAPAAELIAAILAAGDGEATPIRSTPLNAGVDRSRVLGSKHP